MSLGIFAIVGAEFLPASLLTPISKGLDVSEGLAGQMVTMTSAVWLPASLLISVVSGRLDRRLVLIGLTGLMVVSNLLVALAPSLAIALLARALLGVSLGGFWALAAAIMMRLVPGDSVPKALSIMFFSPTTRAFPLRVLLRWHARVFSSDRCIVRRRAAPQAALRC